MPTPTGYTSTVSVALTGINDVDALLYGSKWSTSSLTFSFPDYYSSWDPGYLFSEPLSSSYSPLYPTDQTATRLALNSWASVANISFTEVTESATNVGDLRFAYTSSADSILASAQAWVADFPANSAESGDVWFAVEGGTSSSFNNEWSLGTFYFETVVHEIGHALGLKHPFNTSPSNTQTLQTFLDSRSFTVMSYSADPGDDTTKFSYEPTTPMVLDIQAIQYLYGRNTSYQSGNTPWSYSGSSKYHQTIWDAGGNDTISYTATVGGLIDLRAGIDYGSRLGTPVFVQNSSGTNLYAVNNIWIAYGVTIENATGGSGADLLQGNEVANLLQGQGGNDTIYGAEANDNLVGGDGADSLSGDSGNDSLNGGGGDDFLSGGSGTDTLSGSTGNDTYVVDNAADIIIESSDTVAGGVDRVYSSVNWTLGAAQEVLYLTGSASLNALGNALDNVIGGNSGNNLLDGGAGSDTLVGGIGNDTYVVDSVGDLVVEDSGAGIDLVVSTISYWLGDFLDNLTLSGSANIGGVGNAGSNYLLGNTGNNFLFGGAGSDTIDGGSGSDTADFSDNLGPVYLTLNGATFATAFVGGVAEDRVRNIENIVGGYGADTLTGDAYANVFFGLSGADILNGAGGLDTADYSDTTTGIAVTLNGSIAAAVTVGGFSEDFISNIENIIGGAGSDRITGDALGNRFMGLLGADTINGGAGFDTADYSDTATGISVTLNGAIFVAVAVGGVAQDSLSNIENLVGGSGADTMIGDRYNNVFRGAGGADVLDGSTGVDTADYADKIAAVAITLNGATPVTVTVGGVAEDSIRNIENMIGGGGADVLTGDGFANIIQGMGGMDVINGGAGLDTADYSEKTSSVVVTLGGATARTVTVGGVAEDTVVNIESIYGGTAADTLTGNGAQNLFRGGLGADVIDGSAGLDTAIYSDKTTAVVVSLAGASNTTVTVGGVAEDVIRNIENIVGGSAADTLAGDASNNKLTGNAGNDTLTGGDGDDALAGGLGADSLTGGAGADQFLMDTALSITNTDWIVGFVSGVDKLVLDDDIFRALGVVGTLTGIALSNPAIVQFGTGANDGSDRLIYDQSTGALFYDADGLGGTAQLQFANLGAGTLFSSGDILVVA